MLPLVAAGVGFFVGKRFWYYNVAGMLEPGTALERLGVDRLSPTVGGAAIAVAAYFIAKKAL